MTHLTSEFEDRIWNQVQSQAESQVGQLPWYRVWNKIEDEVWRQLYGHVWERTWNQIRDDIDEK